MSQACCSLTKIAKSGALTALILVPVVVLSLSVFGPWHFVDAAAPAAGDDPLKTLNVLQPVPLSLDNRGPKSSNDALDTVILRNWNYTGGSDGV